LSWALTAIPLGSRGSRGARRVVRSTVQGADVERAVEEAIKRDLEEMLRSCLVEAFYTTLLNFVKASRGYRSLLERPELIVMFLRRNFGASPKYKEGIAELIKEGLRGLGLVIVSASAGDERACCPCSRAWLRVVRRGKGLEEERSGASPQSN